MEAEFLASADIARSGLAMTMPVSIGEGEDGPGSKDACGLPADGIFGTAAFPRGFGRSFPAVSASFESPLLTGAGGCGVETDAGAMPGENAVSAAAETVLVTGAGGCGVETDAGAMPGENAVFAAAETPLVTGAGGCGVEADAGAMPEENAVAGDPAAEGATGGAESNPEGSRPNWEFGVWPKSPRGAGEGTTGWGAIVVAADVWAAVGGVGLDAAFRLVGGVPANFTDFDEADAVAVDPGVSVSVGASDSAVAPAAAASVGLKALSPFAWFTDSAGAGIGGKTPGEAAGGALWPAFPREVLAPAPFAGAVGAELVNRPGIALIGGWVAGPASSR